jgi:amino acid permease
MDMPLQSKDQAFAKLDPAVQHFYRDQLNQRGKLGGLRITSIVTFWLLLLSVLMLFFSWVTGDDIRKLTKFVYVVLVVYLLLYVSKLVIRFIAVRHQNNR